MVEKGRENKILMNGYNQFLGFDLGSDFASEHEYGIKDLLRDFEVDTKKYGLDGMVINEIPHSYYEIHFGEHKGYMILSYPAPVSQVYDDLMPHYENEKFCSAWSDRGFAIAVPFDDDDLVLHLNELHKAIKEKDMVFAFGFREFIQNKGLVLAIKSRFPQEVSEKLIQDSKEREKMHNYVDKLNLKKRLRERGKAWNFYALSPKPISDQAKERSKYPYWFWLNPANQKHVNSGWFTVEEIEQWMQKKGPIPKENFLELCPYNEDELISDKRTEMR